MSGRRSRSIGQRGEREALHKLGEELGVELHRNLQQTRDGGADCLAVKGFVIEVKWVAAMARPTWWRQVLRACERQVGEPMVLWKDRRVRGAPWMALIHTQDGQYREGTLREAAQVIREKWLRWP
jgi:hypothetical protein